MSFIDRVDAGRRLAAFLAARLRTEDVVVLGLPRGGVPVAAEIADALRAPLDVLVVRKLGVPFQPELALGAIGEHGVRVINDAVVRSLRLSAGEVAEVEGLEREELERRLRRYRAGRPAVPLEGRCALVVDDGVATGATARAACLIARARGAARVVLAVPVAPRNWHRRLGDAADEFVCLETPRELFAVGQCYDDFAATTDEEVRDCLRRADRAAGSASARGPRHPAAQAVDPEVVLPVRDGKVAAQLVTPAEPDGIVIFAHGSGSSRHSPRNRYVAEVLNGAGLATLVLDLLTEDEVRDRANVFDVELLADRLHAVTEWVGEWLVELPVGYFGASTGAAAALCAAAEPGSPVRAVVSRGGRPDLAAACLPRVTAPTLLVVGGRDETVIDLNRQAKAKLTCENRLEIVPGATHLFEERGALERVAELAADWFTTHLREAPGAGPRSPTARRFAVPPGRRGPRPSKAPSHRRPPHG
ncbi:MAG TPA: phosphoribosyltransferase family protein [Actinospica sp.]|nr:phosphoribosyltransferase family protein [Actinospica sp.]